MGAATKPLQAVVAKMPGGLYPTGAHRVNSTHALTQSTANGKPPPLPEQWHTRVQLRCAHNEKSRQAEAPQQSFGGEESGVPGSRNMLAI